MITEADVRRILREVVKTNAVDTWDSDFIFVGDAVDSLDHATIALHLDEQYGIKVSDEVLPQLNSISAIIAYAEAQNGPR